MRLPVAPAICSARSLASREASASISILRPAIFV
jgi:hypothetical protein